MYDFEDGNGLVPAKRHVNPDGSEGGWVADTTHVAKTAYIGPEAVIFGSAQICGSAQVCDNAQICGRLGMTGHYIAPKRAGCCSTAVRSIW